MEVMKYDDWSVFVWIFLTSALGSCVRNQTEGCFLGVTTAVVLWSITACRP